LLLNLSAQGQRNGRAQVSVIQVLTLLITMISPPFPPHPTVGSNIFTGKKARVQYALYKRPVPKGVRRYLATISRVSGGKYFNAFLMLDRDKPEEAMLLEFEYANKSDQKEGQPAVGLLAEMTMMTLNSAIAGTSENPRPRNFFSVKVASDFC
jgi:hypothetical protein